MGRAQRDKGRSRDLLIVCVDSGGSQLLARRAVVLLRWIKKKEANEEDGFLCWNGF